jgi:hypothetical protein
LARRGSIRWSIRRRANSSVRRHPPGQLLEQVASQSPVGFRFGFAFQVGEDTLAERVEGLEVADVLGELIIERREHAPANVLRLDGVIDARAGHFLDRVIIGVVDGKALLCAGVQPLQMIVESGRVGFAPDFDHDVVMVLGVLTGRRRLPFDIEGDGVTVFHAPPLDRLVPRGAAAQLLERLGEGVVFQRHSRAAQ